MLTPIVSGPPAGTSSGQSFAVPFPAHGLRTVFQEHFANQTAPGGRAMKIDSVEKLFAEELRDIYNAEQQLVKALPKMAKAANSDELREAIQAHLEETKGQVERLEQVFENRGEK